VITNAMVRPWREARRDKGGRVVARRRKEEHETEAREYIAGHKTGQTEISRRSWDDTETGGETEKASGWER